MKQNTLRIAGAFFLAGCAMIIETAFAQWPYIAIVGCIFAAVGAYCLYRGLYGLFGIMEQDRSEDRRVSQEQQDHLVRVITDLNTASVNRSDQLLKQQRDISDAMNENLEALVQKAEIIIEDLEDASLSIDSLNKALVDSEGCDVPMLSVIAELLKKLPTKIYDEEKELLKQIKEAIHNEESAVTKQMSSLEAALNTYMGNYQAYMERFSQLSEQDLQFINRLMENDDVR